MLENYLGAQGNYNPGLTRGVDEFINVGAGPYYRCVVSYMSDTQMGFFFCV